MAAITATSINSLQNPQEQLKTQIEVETLNKTLKKDGKDIVKTMGKDEFLKLLITELQHQDPTNPMEDREFIAQMAQFSSLEQMLNLNKSMSSLIENSMFQNSFNLLGKNVQIETQVPNEDGTFAHITGPVQSVSKNGGNTTVTVNGKEYPLEAILKVER